MTDNALMPYTAWPWIAPPAVAAPAVSAAAHIVDADIGSLVLATLLDDDTDAVCSLAAAMFDLPMKIR